ncbi:MAG TPA: thioredoxin [Micromonosporaceae bacterium]
MATVELTKDNFEEITKGNPLLVIDFWAEWCGPCRRFAPIFESASERHPDVVFGKVDTEAEPELATTYEIRSIPTIMVVKDATIIHQQPGMLTADLLDELLDQARTVDMAALHAEHEQH